MSAVTSELEEPLAEAQTRRPLFFAEPGLAVPREFGHRTKGAVGLRVIEACAGSAFTIDEGKNGGRGIRTIII